MIAPPQIRPSMKGACSKEVVDVHVSPWSGHDDREGHRGCAYDGRADQHRLGRSLEGVAGSIVGFQ